MGISIFSSFAAPNAAVPKPNCFPIGRVLRANDPALLGKIICRDQAPLSVSGANIRFVCYLNQTLIDLNSLAEINQCCKAPKAEELRQSSGTDMRGQLFRTKGDESRFKVTMPINNPIYSSRPQIAWTPVTTATTYRISVNGEKVSWTTTTQQPSLDYPHTQPELVPGETYQITISVLNNSQPISSINTFLQRLPQTKIDEVNRDLSAVKQLNLSPTETFKDIDTIYVSRGLLSESLSELQRLKNDFASNDLYQLLSTRYRQAGLLEAADAALFQANRLARLL
jgi:hypothetical protein